MDIINYKNNIKHSNYKNALIRKYDDELLINKYNDINNPNQTKLDDIRNNVLTTLDYKINEGNINKVMNDVSKYLDKHNVNYKEKSNILHMVSQQILDKEYTPSINPTKEIFNINDETIINNKGKLYNYVNNNNREIKNKIIYNESFIKSNITGQDITGNKTLTTSAYNNQRVSLEGINSIFVALFSQKIDRLDDVMINTNLFKIYKSVYNETYKQQLSLKDKDLIANLNKNKNNICELNGDESSIARIIIQEMLQELVISIRAGEFYNSNKILETLLKCSTDKTLKYYNIELNVLNNLFNIFAYYPLLVNITKTNTMFNNELMLNYHNVADINSQFVPYLYTNIRKFKSNAATNKTLFLNPFKDKLFNESIYDKEVYNKKLVNIDKVLIVYVDRLNENEYHPVINGMYNNIYLQNENPVCDKTSLYNYVNESPLYTWQNILIHLLLFKFESFTNETKYYKLKSCVCYNTTQSDNETEETKGTFTIVNGNPNSNYNNFFIYTPSILKNTNKTNNFYRYILLENINFYDDIQFLNTTSTKSTNNVEKLVIIVVALTSVLVSGGYSIFFATTLLEKLLSAGVGGVITLALMYKLLNVKNNDVNDTPDYFNLVENNIIIDKRKTIVDNIVNHFNNSNSIIMNNTSINNLINIYLQNGFIFIYSSN